MACSLCRHRRERGTDHVNLILMHATLLMEKSNTRLHKVLEQTLFFNSSVGCGREVCCSRRYEGLILRLPEATRGRGIDLVQKVGILRPLPSSVKMPVRKTKIDLAKQKITFAVWRRASKIYFVRTLTDSNGSLFWHWSSNCKSHYSQLFHVAHNKSPPKAR